MSNDVGFLILVFRLLLSNVFNVVLNLSLSFSLPFRSHHNLYIGLRCDGRWLHATRNRRIWNLQNWIPFRPCDVYIEKLLRLASRIAAEISSQAIAREFVRYSRFNRRTISLPLVPLDCAYRSSFSLSSTVSENPLNLDCRHAITIVYTSNLIDHNWQWK